MLTGSAVDWTDVLDHLIMAVPAIVAAVGVVLVRLKQRELVARSRRVESQLETPSGDPIGHVAERTHDLAAVNAMAVARLENGGAGKREHEQGGGDG